MKISYLSYFIDENTPAYGGSKNEFSLKIKSSIKNGDTANSKEIKMNNHIGTHIDFPNHFSNDGKKSSDYPPSFWVFNKVGFMNCRIEELLSKFKNLNKDIEILILKTDFGINRDIDVYWKSQPVIPSNYAKILKDYFPKLRVFGFDMISLTSKLDRAEGKRAHVEFLLKNDILILEDMNLVNLDSCPNKVIVSPFQVGKIDGVPCTIFSFHDE